MNDHAFPLVAGGFTALVTALIAVHTTVGLPPTAQWLVLEHVAVGVLATLATTAAVAVGGEDTVSQFD